MKKKIATNSKEALELIKKAKKGDTIIWDERKDKEKTPPRAWCGFCRRTTPRDKNYKCKGCN